MDKLLKEVRSTNTAMRELRDVEFTITQLLLLDEMLLEAELAQGMMDGIPMEDWSL